MTKRQRRANLIAILIGLIVTAAVVIAYADGRLERLELIELDLRFRYANPAVQDPRIVCIDIDDTSLEVFGRWPWPRDRQAPLIAIPAELGAQAILVDLNWYEPEAVRSVTPELTGILLDPLTLDSEELESRYPDYELRHTIAEAGNVYLAYDYHCRELETADEFNAAVDALQRGDEAEARRQLHALKEQRLEQRADEGTLDVDQALKQAHIVAALEAQPTLNPAELNAQLNVPVEGFLEKVFEPCREAALVRLIQRWCEESPPRWQTDPWALFTECHEAVAGRPVRGATPLTRAFAIAFSTALGYEVTTRTRLTTLERVSSVAIPVEGITPVHFFQARAAKRCGFVVFEPDRDGVVRRMPLIAQHGGNTLTQLAFTLACDELGVTPDGFSVENGRLKLRTPNGVRDTLTIQLDEQGRTLIPWVAGRNWVRDQFQHLPADAILSLHNHRRDLEHNRALVLEALHGILTTRPFAELADHRRTIEDVLKLKMDIQAARYRGLDEEVRLLQGYLGELEPETVRIEQLVQKHAEGLEKDFAERGVSNADAASREFPPATKLLAVIDHCHRANPELQKVIDDLAARIRNVVAEKICLVGYTATSLADMKPIPTSESAAGVMAHANLLNGLLTGQLVYWASRGANAAIAAGFGVLVAVLSVFMRPRLSILAVALLAVGYMALAGVLAFREWTYWLALTPVVGSIVLPFVGILGYRYVFVEGERRQLATALSQYTSKEIARQVAENPELCRRAEMREVTTMFTDLKGFTTISERIGAARTQEVLNVSLGRFTAVMLRHEGMVNKFIGDGVFAFWNPVIYPQPDHALRACETAVDLLDALERLKEERRQHNGDEVFDELVLRIGVATGNAIVGPCGSEQKYDYTCIGDSVNVASRLESANKFYGTQILVSEATHEQVGDAFEFRALGGVRVKGKLEAVPIYELLGRTRHIPQAARDYAESFGEAVRLFRQRRWQQALDAFAACQKRRPDDLAAEEYHEATATFLANPPGEDWTGAIELTEK